MAATYRYRENDEGLRGYRAATQEVDPRILGGYDGHRCLRLTAFFPRRPLPRLLVKFYCLHDEENSTYSEV